MRLNKERERIEGITDLATQPEYKGIITREGKPLLALYTNRSQFLLEDFFDHRYHYRADIRSVKEKDWKDYHTVMFVSHEYAALKNPDDKTLTVHEDFTDPVFLYYLAMEHFKHFGHEIYEVRWVEPADRG